MPSPQAIVAEKSPAQGERVRVAAVATVVVKLVPRVAEKSIPAVLSGASAIVAVRVPVSSRPPPGPLTVTP